jgi:hypothetical protein
LFPAPERSETVGYGLNARDSVSLTVLWGIERSVHSAGVARRTLGMELAILVLLERHQALADEQITALLHKRPYGVRAALRVLREQGLVEVAVNGEVDWASTSDVTRWRLTDLGRAELTQWMGN